MYIDDNDDLMSSEVIWTFSDVEQELLRAYPNGKALSERVVTIDGIFTWRIDFYPNGKDLKSFGVIIVAVTLEKVNGRNVKPVDADCTFSYKNKKRRKHFFGKIPLRRFEIEQTEEDSSFDNSILKECESNHPMHVTITINQYPEGYVYSSSTESLNRSESTASLNKSFTDLSSATPKYSYFSSAERFDEDDFKKDKVNYLYNRKIYS